MFKVGDVVRKKNGERFSNGRSTAAIASFDRDYNDRVWIRETATYISINNIELAYSELTLERILNDLKSQLKAKEDEVAKIKKAISLLEEI